MVTRKFLCTVAFAAIGSVLWVSPVLAQPIPILELAIADTARVVDYENGIYVVGTTDGDLDVMNQAGEYTVTALAATGPEANTGDDLAVMQKGAHDDGRG